MPSLSSCQLTIYIFLNKHKIIYLSPLNGKWLELCSISQDRKSRSPTNSFHKLKLSYIDTEGEESCIVLGTLEKATGGGDYLPCTIHISIPSFVIKTYSKLFKKIEKGMTTDGSRKGLLMYRRSGSTSFHMSFGQLKE